MSSPQLACLEFLFNAQKERGLVALYLSGTNEQAAAELQKQFALTDAAIEKIWELPRRPGAKSEGMFRFFQDLSRQRHHIVARFTKPADAVERYSQGLVAPAIALITEVMIHDSRNAPSRVNALASLLQWQEQIAIERETGILRMKPEWLSDTENIARLKEIVGEQQTYERLFFGLTDDAGRQVMASLKHLSAPDDPADEINAAIVTGRTWETLSHATVYDWHTFFSAQVATLYDAAKKLAAQLQGDGDYYAPGLGQILDSDVEAHADLIQSLPLFKGLGPVVMRQILHAARIVHHEKGSLFLTQGEQAARFFIILDGFVKTFKSTAEGDEAILQILGKKEALLDADALNPKSACNVSARAITKTKLLAIPATPLREALRQHKDLALNMLAVMTRHAQRLVSQFEQMTLRSATERVGWFLLNLHLETALDTQPIVLPFDKALIASWLNIKPETFSRILQTFRTAGFKINRQQIDLPEPYALCDFCDPDAAQKCRYADTDRCPRADVRVAKEA